MDKAFLNVSSCKTAILQEHFLSLHAISCARYSSFPAADAAAGPINYFQISSFFPIPVI